ncbi:MAG TPA: type IV pilin protein [Burkholderiaceae bacterium]|nr:type IV pilin protein [Burkholderiaceae bacterium]
MNIRSTLRPAAGTYARRTGFTLVELMIVVALIAILATIAYPSYTSHVRKAKRATAQAALVDVGAKEQAYLLERRSYATTLADLAFAAPQEIDGAYTITLAVDNAASPMTFIVTATPINSQATAGEQTLTLNQAGARTPAGSTGYWGQ